MRLDRSHFLFAASTLLACHAEHKRRDEPARVVTEMPEPEPDPAPEPSSDGGSDAVDPLAAVVLAVDAGPADATAEAAAPAAPPGPPPTAAELGRRCRAIPAEKECANARRAMCQTALAEFDRATAARATECLESAPSCDVCAIRTCVQGTLAAAPKQQVSACETVRKAYDAQSPGDGEHMFELCELYASGMNARGRARFTRCLAKHPGIGIRFCIWDPSTTPCTERGDGPRVPGPSFP